MGEHAYFSPSAASRWLACPASLYLSEHLKESKTSKFAHEGTVCHEVAATCLTKQGNPLDFQGKIVQGVTLTPELINGMQLYVDEIRGLAKEYSALGGKIEHKVQLTTECWGTVDALLWNKEVALVCDLKMGKGIVIDVEDNAQLKIYAIGALRWLQEEHNIMPLKVLSMIIQPRTPNPIRIAELSYEELFNWYKGSVIGVLQTHGKGKKSPIPCNPGVTQCRWCPVNVTCGAQASKIVNDTQKAFSPFTKAEPPQADETEDTLSLASLIEYKKTFAHIQQWIKGIESYIMDKALAGTPIPGFKLVEGRSTRIWKAGEKEVEAFLKNVNIEPFVVKLLSPPQAEKAMGKKLAKESELASIVIKPEGKPTLVPEIDKRLKLILKTDQQIAEDFVDVCVAPKAIPEVLLVDEKKESNEPQRMSALKRMQMATFEDEDEKVEETPTTITQTLVETATGGNPKCVMKVTATGVGTPPSAKTKRYQVLQFGSQEGGMTLSEAANKIECTEYMIKMHLRYLHERDGYSYRIFDDNSFIIGD